LTENGYWQRFELILFYFIRITEASVLIGEAKVTIVMFNPGKGKPENQKLYSISSKMEGCPFKE